MLTPVHFLPKNLLRGLEGVALFLVSAMTRQLLSNVGLFARFEALRAVISVARPGRTGPQFKTGPTDDQAL